MTEDLRMHREADKQMADKQDDAPAQQTAAQREVQRQREQGFADAQALDKETREQSGAEADAASGDSVV